MKNKGSEKRKKNLKTNCMTATRDLGPIWINSLFAAIAHALVYKFA